MKKSNLSSVKRYKFKFLTFFLVLLLGAVSKPCDAKKGKWIRLFNGKDLKGWAVKINGYELNDNYGGIFRVEDGILKVSYDQCEQFDNRFGHIFYNKKFSNYILRVEYRFVGEQVAGAPAWAFRNSGVMIHCQSPESMEKDQKFPVCLEAQLLGGNGVDDRPTANVATIGTRVILDGELTTKLINQSNSTTLHGDQWVTLEVEVHGNSLVKHILNGETVLQYEEPQLNEDDEYGKKLLLENSKMISEGYIALQAESHPIEFRKVEIMLIDK